MSVQPLNVTSPLPTLFEDYNYTYDENETLVVLNDDELGRFLETSCGVLFILIFILSLVGNGLLLWVVLCHSYLSRTSSIFVLNLVASDLLFSISLPFWATYYVTHWVFGTFMCQLVSFIFFAGLYSYMAFLVAITVERYVTVVHAMSYFRSRGTRRAYVASSCIWVVCLAGSLPEAIYSEAQEMSDKTVCNFTLNFHNVQLLMVYMQVILFFLVPFAVITFCYARVWATIKQKCKSEKKRRAFKLILWIIIGFFICWAPYNLVLFFQPLPSGAVNAEKLKYAFSVCHALAYCHCCLSPFSHLCGSGEFRSHLSSRCNSVVCRHRTGHSVTSHNSSQKVSVSSMV